MTAGTNCEWAVGCRRKATDRIDEIAMCSPCQVQYQIWKASQRVTASKGIRPLDLIPDSVPAKSCGCGCGETISKPRGFRPGHDAKLKSRLLIARKQDQAAAQAKPTKAPRGKKGETK